MQITALGHSCVLLSFDADADDADAGGAPTRILVDPWLSDHATGDAMGRFPRLRFEASDLGPIHAVYLTHAHCDHLDPYTLLRLWRELPDAPTLILPASLSFLVPVLSEYLDPLDLILLPSMTPTPFRGVELLGVHDVGFEPNNEEDVMVLVVTSGRERVLVEADARLALDLPRFRAFLAGLLSGPEVDSAVWLTTENELTGTMLGRTCQDAEERAEVMGMAHDELLAAVAQLYAPPGAPEEGEDLWQNPRLLRLIHGQGLTIPQAQDPRWQRILFPVTVADRVAAEHRAAMQGHCRHRVDALTVGAVHTVEAGRITARTPLSGLTLLDDEADRAFDLGLDWFPALPQAPVWGGPRDVAAQRARILAVLNHRFLPHLHGLRQPPVLHLLAERGGEYRIRVHFGDVPDADARDYVLSFAHRDFVAHPADEYVFADEQYWANDLLDMVDGRCDEFSPTCRRQLPTEHMRLWESLATPLLNSDLVARRVALHLARAAAGETPGSWVAAMWAGGAPPA